MRGVGWAFDALLDTRVFATASMVVATSAADVPLETVGDATGMVEPGVGIRCFAVGGSMLLLVLDRSFTTLLSRPDPMFVQCRVAQDCMGDRGSVNADE